MQKIIHLFLLSCLSTSLYAHLPELNDLWKYANETKDFPKKDALIDELKRIEQQYNATINEVRSNLIDAYLQEFKQVVTNRLWLKNLEIDTKEATTNNAYTLTISKFHLFIADEWRNIFKNVTTEISPTLGFKIIERIHKRYYLIETANWCKKVTSAALEITQKIFDANEREKILEECEDILSNLDTLYFSNCGTLFKKKLMFYKFDAEPEVLFTQFDEENELPDYFSLQEEDCEANNEIVFQKKLEFLKSIRQQVQALQNEPTFEIFRTNASFQKIPHKNILYVQHLQPLLKKFTDYVKNTNENIQKHITSLSQSIDFVNKITSMLNHEQKQKLFESKQEVTKLGAQQIQIIQTQFKAIKTRYDSFLSLPVENIFQNYFSEPQEEIKNSIDTLEQNILQIEANLKVYEKMQKPFYTLLFPNKIIHNKHK